MKLRYVLAVFLVFGSLAIEITTGSPATQCNCAQSISPCQCYSDGWMDCNKKGLTKIPTNLPACSKILSMGNNSITNIGIFDLRTYSAARRIWLTNNSITKIEPGAFAWLKNVTALDLSENLLISLNKCTFSGMTSLTRLNLQGNRIAQVADRAFDNLPSLQTLWLYKNALSYFSLQWFRNKPKLLIVNDDQNAWNCSCDLWAEYMSVRREYANIASFCLPNGQGSLCIKCSMPSLLRDKHMASLSQTSFAHCADTTTSALQSSTPLQTTEATTYDSRLGVTGTAHDSANYCEDFVAAKINSVMLTTKVTTATVQTRNIALTEQLTTATTTEQPTTTVLDITPKSTTQMIVHTKTLAYQGLAPWGIAMVVLGVVVMICVIALAIVLIMRHSAEQRKTKVTETVTSPDESEAFNSNVDVKL